MPDKKFLTNKLATIYDHTSQGGVVSIGTMDPKTAVTYSDIVTVGGSNYCVISAKCGSAYVDKTYGQFKAAVGKLIPEADIIEVANDGTGVVTAVSNSGYTNKIIGIQFQDPAPLYRVKSSSYCPIYSGPGAEYIALGKYFPGESLSVYATYRDPSGAIWGSTSRNCDQWMMYKFDDTHLVSALTSVDTPAQEDSVASSAITTITSNSYGVVDASDDVYASMNDAAALLLDVANTPSFDDSNALNALHNMQYVIGIPPKITETADICYMKDAHPSNNFGRCYTELFMMENTLFSIQPCKVKYLPGFSSKDKNEFFDKVADAVSNAGNDSPSELTGQLFEGQPDYGTYINTVNLLARTFAIYLGIGDEPYMGKSVKYKEMDYSFYKIHRPENSGAARNGVFGAIADSAERVADSIIASVINDDTYTHFYMTADGTSVDDSMSVSTRQSGLESLFNTGFSELAQEIQFLGGGNSGIAFDEALAEAEANPGPSSGLGTTISNIVKYSGNYLKGGRLVFPQMVDDCTYDRSYRGSCRFISPSGDPEAIFLNCYLPLAYLLPYVLPQMLSDNMYRYPFLARVNAQGMFHCDLAAITNLQIQRGGSDGTSWTADGLPFEIDVSFNVTPLYSKLMVTSARHPVLFLSNSALHEYLGAMCGISFTGTDMLRKKIDMIGILLGNTIQDLVPSMLRGYYSSGVANWLRKKFTMS